MGKLNDCLELGLTKNAELPPDTYLSNHYFSLEEKVSPGVSAVCLGGKGNKVGAGRESLRTAEGNLGQGTASARLLWLLQAKGGLGTGQRPGSQCGGLAYAGLLTCRSLALQSFPAAWSST